MKKINLMDRVLFALSVPTCVCCKRRLDYGEKSLCPECYAKFEEFKSRNCSFCGRRLDRCDCSNDFLKGHYVNRVIKCFRYLNREGAIPGNSLVYSLKRDNRKDVLELCTDELSASIMNSIDDPSSYVFTNIPRRRGAIVEYGIDHSELLAKALARRFGARYIPILRSNATKEQKSLETEDRMKNAKFYIARNVDLTGNGIIIVDDIITSGASMSRAAALIRSLGAKNIVAASLGIAYKDK